LQRLCLTICLSQSFKLAASTSGVANPPNLNVYCFKLLSHLHFAPALGQAVPLFRNVRLGTQSLARKVWPATFHFHGHHSGPKGRVLTGRRRGACSLCA
jgi:hypothetical protein